MDFNPVRQTLQDAIEHLYLTFQHYRLKTTIYACPYCVSDGDHAKLHTKPLRKLTDNDLEKYAFKALTTWGDADDFRHFLPRLFELEVLHPQRIVGLSDPEILFGKLAYADWHTWDIAEQRGIHAYFEALWSYVVLTHEPTPWTYSDDYLCGIGRAVQTVTPFLLQWQSFLTRTAMENLQRFLEQNENDIMQRGALKNSFWDKNSQQMQEVVVWVLNPRTVATFEAAFEAHIDTSIADTLANIIDKFHTLKRYA